MSYVLKVGGTVAEDTAVVGLMCAELRRCAEAATPPHRPLLIHGGGKYVSTVSRKLGMEPLFQDGVRVTSLAEMAVVEMGLCGVINGEIVRAARRAGVAAWGLRGSDAGLVIGHPVAPDNRTAVVHRVDPTPLRLLWSAGFLPVLASVAADQGGEAVNINADEYAQAIAQAVRAERLIFVSDIPGVLDQAGSRIADLTVAEIEPLITAGVAVGGMAAKLRACAEAIRAGVGGVVIGDYRRSGDLEALIEGTRGTTIHG